MEATKYGETLGRRLGTEAQSLDTVRALHQTVVALRLALDKSRAELQALRVRVRSEELYSSTIEKLSLENHILRRRILDEGGGDAPAGTPAKEDPPAAGEVEVTGGPMASQAAKDASLKEGEVPATAVVNEGQTGKEGAAPPDGNVKTVSSAGVGDAKNVDADEKGHSDLSQDKVKQKPGKCPAPGMDSVDEADENAGVDKVQAPDQSACSKGSQNDAAESPPGKNNGESDNESEELDDIELIFTTEETKELGVLQEDLVSITDADNWQSAAVAPPTSLKFADADQFEEVSEEVSVVREKTEEKSTVTLKQSNLTKTWTQSVLVETDISKCGVVDELEMMGRVSRRNTLPNPLVYQPASSREQQLSGSRGHLGGAALKFPPRPGRDKQQQLPVRPILMERSAVKRESEAQTDITALPSHWKSESYLAHKVAHNFPTLPSKFALPLQQVSATTHRKYSLRLSDKTQEARRTLLSDINFTSMVPELSRSADHLCQAELEAAALCRNYPQAHSYMAGSSLISPGFGNSCDYSRSGLVHFGSSQNRLGYRGSLSSVLAQRSFEYPAEARRRHSWRPSVGSIYRTSSLSQKPSWGSVPSSPTRCRWAPQSDVDIYCASYWGGQAKYPIKTRTRSKVTFLESPPKARTGPGRSLPDLRLDLDLESGDSTDSLIDEAEEYLRRSIDSMLTGADWSQVGVRRQTRRFSEPDVIREFMPPKNARPFLPKVPRDLKLNYFVKVISAKGRVMVGRVRYVGPVPARPDTFVGVELPQDDGNSDGSFQGRRFFDCDPDCAIFVPFKKVVMAWSV